MSSELKEVKCRVCGKLLFTYTEYVEGTFPDYTLNRIPCCSTKCHREYRAKYMRGYRNEVVEDAKKYRKLVSKEEEWED